MTNNILVADDEKHTLRLLDFTLRKKNTFQVFTANSGNQALELCKNHQMNLIIIDYLMPDMNGVETIQQIRLLENYQQTPVIMLTARGINDVEERLKELHVSRFLTKPFSPSELIKLATELCEPTP